jgi:hypothetical protein
MTLPLCQFGRLRYPAMLMLPLWLAAAALPAHGQSLASLSPGTLGMPPLPVVARALPVARPLFAAATPGQQCRHAIHAAERAANIPEQLMAAIARIESGRREADGSVNPWPWSINVEGTDRIFESKTEAVAAVRKLQARGVRSIDVGCMQVNLLHHPDAFASLDDAFDPVANAAYAARFLVQLRQQTGTWPTATAWYHSATPALGEDYRRKVMAVWPEEMHKRPDNARTDLASAWAATRPTGAASFAAGAPAGNRAAAARLLPPPTGTAGKGLAGYRALPIPLAARPLPISAGSIPNSRG